MTELVAPRIAEFPKASWSKGLAKESLESVPLSVAHEWLVHEFGEGELAKVKGLPVHTVASLYPEMEGTVFFSMVRGTPQLEEMQALLDAIVEFREKDEVALLAELEKLRAWKQEQVEQDDGWNPAAMQEAYFWVHSPDYTQGFYFDSYWAIEAALDKEKGQDRDDRFLIQVRELVHNLMVFVCAPQVIETLHRAEYAVAVPPYENLFRFLGLDDLWAIVSTRVDAWRDGDDDD